MPRGEKGEPGEGGDKRGYKTCRPPPPPGQLGPQPHVSVTQSVIALEGQFFFFLSFGTAKKDEEPISRSL